MSYMYVTLKVFYLWPGVLINGGNASVLARGPAAVGGGQGGAALLQVPGLQPSLFQNWGLGQGYSSPGGAAAVGGGQGGAALLQVPGLQPSLMQNGV